MLKCFVYYSVTLTSWRPATMGLWHTFIHIHTSYNQFVYVHTLQYEYKEVINKWWLSPVGGSMRRGEVRVVSPWWKLTRGCRQQSAGVVSWATNGEGSGLMLWAFRVEEAGPRWDPAATSCLMRSGKVFRWWHHQDESLVAEMLCRRCGCGCCVWSRGI